MAPSRQGKIFFIIFPLLFQSPWLSISLITKVSKYVNFLRQKKIKIWSRPLLIQEYSWFQVLLGTWDESTCWHEGYKVIGQCQCTFILGKMIWFMFHMNEYKNKVSSIEIVRCLLKTLLLEQKREQKR